MTHSRADVEQLAKAQFPGLEPAVVLSILDEYGKEAHEEERERVQLAILKLSSGDEGKLLHNVVAAKQDYRDVLMWSEEPEPSPGLAAAELGVIERILRALGAK
jgi:hypothetical protein